MPTGTLQCYHQLRKFSMTRYTNLPTHLQYAFNMNKADRQTYWLETQSSTYLGNRAGTGHRESATERDLTLFSLNPIHYNWDIKGNHPSPSTEKWDIKGEHLKKERHTNTTKHCYIIVTRSQTTSTNLTVDCLWLKPLSRNSIQYSNN